MIYLYTGTPGSGKSLHLARDIFYKLKLRKDNVIANFPIDESVVFGKKDKSEFGCFIYRDNSEINVKYLVDYARKYHIVGKEGQTLLCLDECQVMFNPRDFGRKDRMEWNNFFSQHRKLGYNVILITQNDRLIDRQIRALVEYEVRHRKINNFKIGALLPFPVFVGVSYWYGVKEKLDVEFFMYKKKFGKLYDSYKMFDDDFIEEVPKKDVDIVSKVYEQRNKKTIVVDGSV